MIQVRNLPPEVNLDGEQEIDIGELLMFENTTPNDPDGGSTSHHWDLVQVPDGAGASVGDDFSTSHPLSFGTSAADAGTWVFRYRIEDNEGHEEEDEISVLVDAPVEADISGPSASSAFVPLQLSGQDSVDPDSPCPGQADRCHSTDGRAVSVSPGTVRYVWSVLDFPSDAPPSITTGPASDVFHLDGAGELLSIPAARLSAGRWRFQLEVEDGEGNLDAATHEVEIIIPDGPPFAITPAPAVHVLGPGNLPTSIIGFSGFYSFDLDNLLDGESFAPGLGITSYAWTPAIAPSCPLAVPASGAVVPLFADPSVPVPASCEGYYVYGLVVTDDDPSPKTGSASQTLIITACPDLVCIENPTEIHPIEIPFSDQTDVEIQYKVDASLYTLAGCALGCTAGLEIFHASDSLVPAFTAFEYNPQPTGIGATPVFKWNGYVSDGIGGFIRPLPGVYSTQIKLYALDGTEIASDFELANILVQVADADIDPASSDDYLSLNAAEAGTDSLAIAYQSSGSASYTEVRLDIYPVGGSTPEAVVQQPASGPGTIVFDGRVGPGAFIDPGRYEATVTLIAPAGELDTSERHPFTAYRLDLEVAGVAEADEESDGAEIEVGGGGEPLRLVIEPDTLPGDILLTEAAPTTVLGPPVYAGGHPVPAASANPEHTDTLEVSEAPTDEVRLVARYLPPGAPPLKEATDEVVIIPLAVDATAPCSEDGREDAEGLFLSLKDTPSMLSFAERFWMRKLDLMASIQADEIVIRQSAGAAGAVAVLVPTAPMADPSPVALPHSIPASLHQASGRLETEVYVRGIASDPIVVLEFEMLRGGTVLAHDTVRFRVGPLPPLAGQPLPAFPHWRTTPFVVPTNPVGVALDPALFDERRGLTGHVYLVEHKDEAGWAADPSLTDVTGEVEALAVPAAGDITASQLTAWASATSGAGLRELDVVIDFGDCSAMATTDGTLDPEDIVTTPAALGLVVASDLSAAGPNATGSFDYGTDFERGGAGAVCTPTTEDPAGGPCAPCPAGGCVPPGSSSCGFGKVCVDTDADGNFRCTDVDPAGTPPCPANERCVNTNDDEVARCRGPAPERIAIPVAYDTLAGPTLEAGGEFRLRGRVVHPQPLGASHPLVVIAHGRHTPKHVALASMLGRDRWVTVHGTG